MKHVRLYHEQKYDYVCDRCEYRALTNTTLKLHIKSIHDKIKDEVCHLCPFSTSRAPNLQEHIRTVLYVHLSPILIEICVAI